MGVKKEAKKEVQKRENGTGNERKWSINDPINTDKWRCVVTMAVEKTNYDCFVLKEFLEESSFGRRRDVKLIDHDAVVMKILSDFASGELPYKYAFLLNFSSVFQEAVDYINRKMEIPIHVLVKIIKALLFFFREESLSRIQKSEIGIPDPIKAMADRPRNFGSTDFKKKDVIKKGETGLKVRPPSTTKEDTELLKRGQPAREDQCIDDAPRNAYFNLYVLLSGFYNPDFPLELIKANIPFHALVCIDTSRSGVKRDETPVRHASHKQIRKAKSEEIQNFWLVFLKNLWDPEVSFYFKDTVFQVYVPQRLLCEKKKLQEFIYSEISYLMYDLSDFKRQLNNFLDHMNLWCMEEYKPIQRTIAWPETLSNECTSVPIILYFIIDAICESDWIYHRTLSSGSIDLGETAWKSLELNFSLSKHATYGSCAVGSGESQLLEEKRDYNLLNVYLKTKELDVKYDLDNKHNSSNSEWDTAEMDDSQPTCSFHPPDCGENLQEILSSEGSFRSFWNKYNKHPKPLYTADYCLYALLMTKVTCPYQSSSLNLRTRPNHSLKNNSAFQLIENLSGEMRKPHFTVTDGSRNILNAVPHNVKDTSRDFFSPEQFKIVTPEKMKASSSPEFRQVPSLKVQRLYKSEICPGEISKNPYDNLRGFVTEDLFSKTNDFDFLEYLSKRQLLSKEHQHWNNYNCIDHAYSLINDCILLTLHNRKNRENVHHETFNVTLDTTVGLRDFYDYVLEDKAAWLAMQEESYQTRVFLPNKILNSDSFRDFTDSDFYLAESLKYKYDKKSASKSSLIIGVSSTEALERGKMDFDQQLLESVRFEGYDVSDTVVQYSGLKSVYYSKDASVTVQLVERLYGNQDVSIQVTEASHTLHLHHYACPVPHPHEPFTFHVSYKNGIVAAFGRRLIETHEELEENFEARSEKDSSELSTTLTHETQKHVEMTQKTESLYDLAVSLPNGLSVRTVRKVVTPCYIKQLYLVSNEEIAKCEKTRLFLPNGNLIKIFHDDTVQILKVDSSIVTASLKDLTRKTESENLNFSRYEVVSGEGDSRVFEKGKMTSSKRLHVFQNVDMNANQVYFRRTDGTNYMLQSNGTLSVQFKDGTKMSSSLFIQDESSVPSEEVSDQSDFTSDFILVFVEITTEHPDYATVIYNSQTQEWRILLPYESTIAILPDGRYSVDIDPETELQVEPDVIRMSYTSSEGETHCSFTADLSVFGKTEGGVYCRMKDDTGKTFVIEANSNSYILEGEEPSEENHSLNDSEVHSKTSDMSEFVASTDLQISPSTSTERLGELLPENRYFVLRRDLSGAELLHKDEVRKALTRTQPGSLVFTQDIPGSNNRCFVLVTPGVKRELKKWGVPSILPNPKYEPDPKKRTTSTTYGIPPSWMHPFPKRKLKFSVPQPLTCRVFIETKKTDLSPETGTIDCHNCEINELEEVKHAAIPPGGVEEYLKRLSEDDQDLLKEIYHLAAASVINKTRKSKRTNSEKLEHYLEMSRYYVAMREHHKKSIRYHIIPDYFHHPAGMSWLILNDLLLKLKLFTKTREERHLLKKTVDFKRSSPGSTSRYSYEEVEYNLSVSAGRSFSSLSCRTDITAKTAPSVLRTGGVPRCKVKPLRCAASSPVVWCPEKYVETGFEDSQSGICGIREKDFEMLEEKEGEGRDVQPMSLEDLMYLGLI